MEYSVTCSCRNIIPVTATQAGTEVACRCGRTVMVPRLSQLRTAVGRAAYKPTVIEAIDRLICSGDLPFGDQRKLRELLRPVPIYQQLLEEYPRAHVHTDA